MKGTTLIRMVSILFLWMGGLSGAPQDHWYAERDRNFGYLEGIRYPIDVVHGDNGKAFVIELDNDRAQFFDQNNSVFSVKGVGDEPRAVAYGNGKLFVISIRSDRVSVLDENGTSLYNFGSRGSGNGQFETGLGIATGYNGNDLEVFVSDESYDRIQVFDEFGNFKRKFSTVNGSPRGIAIDGNGSIYVADVLDRVDIYDRNGTHLRSITGISGDPYGLSIHGNRMAVGNSHSGVDKVRIYDLNGTFIREFGTGGSGTGQFESPHGVSYAENGNIWVADYYNHRVQIFDGNGTFLSQLGEHANSPFLSNPSQMATDSQNFYLSDTVSNRVVVMNQKDGSYVRTIARSGTGLGQVTNPMGIAIDGQGKIYVVDSGNDRIQVFENNGTFLRSFGNSGIFSSAWGIALAEDGTVYVSDSGANQIRVFDGSGNLTGSWGESGSLINQLDNPCGLQIGPDGDLYVADFNNRSIKRFSVSGELKLAIDLRNHGGSTNGSSNHGAFPISLAVRGDGVIFTSARDGTSITEFWAFDKLGTALWNTKVNFGTNRGLVAVTPQGDFTWAFEGSAKYRAFRSSYRAGPLIMEDAIPYPILISATQEFETTDLDIVYKVTDADDTNVTTGLLAYIDGDDSFDKILLPKTFIGDVTGKIGQNVDVNVTHSLSWDMPSDWNASVGTVAVEVFAKDDRELLDLHFVEIPGDENNATPLVINRFPLKDADFLAAYRYLLATGDPEIKLEKGVVMASDTNSTPVRPDSLPGLALWLDAADMDGNGQPDTLPDASLVSVWKDKSGNDFNASQPVEGNQPRYKNNNGVPKIYYNAGYENWLKLTGVNINAEEIFIVAEALQKPGYNVLLSTGLARGHIRSFHNNLNFEQHHSHSFAGSDGTYRIDGFGGSTFQLSTKHILYVSRGSDTIGAGLYPDIWIGNEGATIDNNKWKGNIYEILIFDQPIGSEARTNIEWYLGQKWGIRGPMPWGGKAVKNVVKQSGQKLLLKRMNLRLATASEKARAHRGTTPGRVSQFAPDFRIQPSGDPEKINEFTIETKRGGSFVVPI